MLTPLPLHIADMMPASLYAKQQCIGGIERRCIKIIIFVFAMIAMRIVWCAIHNLVPVCAFPARCRAAFPAGALANEVLKGFPAILVTIRVDGRIRYPQKYPKGRAPIPETALSQGTRSWPTEKKAASLLPN